MEYLDRVLLGDAAKLPTQLPAGIVQTIVTSPPYWKHRRYNPNDPLELGQEPTLDAYVLELTHILNQCGRLLRDDGTLWLNLGDTFIRKELQGVPWTVALTLKEMGWRLRSEIIWEKPNAKPSAVRDRPTVSHETLFLFTRSWNYYYDVDAIREQHVTFTDASKMSSGRAHFGKVNGTPEVGKYSGDRNLHKGRWDQAFHPLGRNRRTVWSIPTGKCREAHFSVMPDALVEPCILAGSPVDGLVLDPFMGAGTTARVARRLGRHYLGFDIVPYYLELTDKRLKEIA